MTNLYTIKARLAELREELMNHAAAWSDVPGGADNPIAQAEYARIWKISIHAPRAGSDQQAGIRRLRSTRISIHAPRAGSDADFRLLPLT